MSRTASREATAPPCMTYLLCSICTCAFLHCIFNYMRQATAVLTQKPFRLKGRSDSKAVLTQRPARLKGRSDSKAVLP